MLEGGFHAVCPVPFRDTPCVKPFVGYCSVFALVLTEELGMAKNSKAKRAQAKQDSPRRSGRSRYALKKARHARGAYGSESPFRKTEASRQDVVTYRAAFWVAEDRQGEIVLTGPEHASLPDAALLIEAASEAARNDVDLTTGSIEMGHWSEEVSK